MSVRRLDPVQPDSFAFSAENLAWAKKTISKYPEGKQASAVIPLLWRAQEQNDGWVTRPAIEYVASMLGMSDIRVLEVATFYTMFQLSPVGKKAHIQVCGTTPCMLRGAEDLKAVCQHRIHHEPHHLNADGSLSWEEVECLGSCVNAPMIQIFKDTYEDLTPESLEKLIDDIEAGRPIKPGPQNGRQHSAPEGGPIALTDPSLYAGQRTFVRVEPPPPPPPAETTPPASAAPAAPAPIATIPAGTPAPAAAAPKPEEIRLVTAAAVAADAAKAAVKPDAPKPVTTPRPSTEVKAVEITNPGAPKPIKIEDHLGKPMHAPVAAKPKAEPKPRPEGQPELFKKPRTGSKADDLKLIWGVGPALEKLLNKMGVWHFDQIASWTAKELAWVDERLEGFKGRAKRDDWISQSKKLATGWRPDNPVGEKPKKKK
ncbi:NADH-quinone oxidoreductase subunit NuoE [Aestuariivirga sp.]|uniref:NADH-quinone oxidoreductase subunit NuoE n=1 Tax=Aestuariivirga sp. TaxID=2650926 RepID=UPI0039E418E5